MHIVIEGLTKNSVAFNKHASPPPNMPRQNHGSSLLWGGQAVSYSSGVSHNGVVKENGEGQNDDRQLMTKWIWRSANDDVAIPKCALPLGQH